ncbi:PREDICTED: uncharacterized protein LOC104818058 [Tarenaya hassleriana]|uniref:uncharacterized protein LOC104818058 n=1 Tax=Tarenaya hassleriana TaxID=28532 RepID=UPI00053C8FDA|nr:PREDICTED: uncharacterized protein LOC104818058 [Tarenaya hassleriana]
MNPPRSCSSYGIQIELTRDVRYFLVNPTKKQRMQAVRRNPPREGLETPATERANRVGRRNNGSGIRARFSCTCSGRPGSARCVRHGYLVPNGERRMMRRASEGSREILRRALTPPSRRMSLRWWNFRPTPSRLCNMSSA